MEDKELYTPAEVADIAKGVSKFIWARNHFFSSIGVGTAEAHNWAEELLKEIKSYKKLPKNIKEELELDINALEKECRSYL